MKVKSLVAILLLVSVSICFFACSNDTSSTTPPTKILDTPTPDIEVVPNSSLTEEKVLMDNSGYYKEELSQLLGSIGNVYWNPTLKSYVLNPRGSYRDLIFALVADPTNNKYLSLWDDMADVIAEASDLYSCTICVANPVNAEAHLLIVGFGDILVSTF